MFVGNSSKNFVIESQAGWDNEFLIFLAVGCFSTRHGSTQFPQQIPFFDRCATSPDPARAYKPFCPLICMASPSMLGCLCIDYFPRCLSCSKMVFLFSEFIFAIHVPFCLYFSRLLWEKGAGTRQRWGPASKTADVPRDGRPARLWPCWRAPLLLYVRLIWVCTCNLSLLTFPFPLICMHNPWFGIPTCLILP